jgi:protein O-mannosyl-transferase
MVTVKNTNKQFSTPAKRAVKNPPIKQPQKYSLPVYVFPIAVFLLCFIIYGNSIINGYTYDDKIYTYDNAYIVKGFSAIKEIFNQGSLNGVYRYTPGPQYRPLTLLNFMTEVSVFGLNPHVNHFFNILFFAITVVLLYFFLQKILKNYNQAIIFASTVLFAFHPIHTEVVDSIKSRDEILGLLFGLTSFYSILLYKEKNNNKYYFFSLAAFSLAIFCKENCLTFVIIIPLLLYFFTSMELKKIAIKSIPYFLLVGFYLFIRNLVLHKITFTSQIPVWDNALMAAKNNADMTATSFVLLGKYIYMTIIPYPLSWDYSFHQIPIVTWGDSKPIIALLVCLGLIGFMLWGAGKKSIYSFLIALFFITLFLSSNLVIKIAATLGERFLYVPSLSFCIALPILTAKVLKLNPFQLVWKKTLNFYIPIIIILIIYAVIVIPRNRVWENEYTLFKSGVETSPFSGRTHGALGGIYMDTAQNSNNPVTRKLYNALSIKEFKTASELAGTYPGYYYNLGLCYTNEGNQDSALIAYKATLIWDTGYSYAATNLGLIYFNKAKYDTAIYYFHWAYRADTTNTVALMDLGATYQNKGNMGLAMHYDSLVLIKDPKNKQALANLSSILSLYKAKN